ncbi:hypothetical protein TNCV_2659431 [Trichonephila clavipes]|uniref:Uncharacterized protein n=1 Tax=Trichonephila clavipes TaxID=2585209 RepID=A0A8X6UYA5_TRICX|nr:hypothetical protein TNCV_2659431 [Trichonephila clavipes]
MIRWALKLFEFKIEWEHRPGGPKLCRGRIARNPVGNLDGSLISCAALRSLALNSLKQLIREEGEEPELRHIYRYLENPDDAFVNATVCEEELITPPRDHSSWQVPLIPEIPGRTSHLQKGADTKEVDNTTRPVRQRQLKMEPTGQLRGDLSGLNRRQQ